MPLQKTSFGVPSLMFKQTPQWATAIATASLYIAAIVNGFFLYFPAILPANEESNIGKISAAAVGFVHFLCNMFGITPSAPPSQPTSSTPSSSNVAKAILILFLLSACTLGASAQFFKPVPKPGMNKHNMALSATATTDSTFSGIRPVAIAAAYGYQSGGVSTLMAGTGLGWKHLIYDATTQKWNSQYSINMIAWAQGQIAPSGTINPFAFSFGPTIGLVNDNIMFGAAWDFSHGKPMIILSFSIPTNN